MPETNTNIDVAVIGAGIIGVCIALELVERGLNVAIFDPAAVCSKTSYGNAGVISPWTCVPQALPGLWKHLPGWLIRPNGPVSIGGLFAFLPGHYSFGGGQS